MNILKKRTNNRDLVSEIIVKSLIPIFLSLLIFTEGVIDSAIGVIEFSLFFLNPASRLYISETVNDVSYGDRIDMNLSDTESKETVSSGIVTSIPEDVLQIMVEAQQTYADSSNDGKIIESDYSTQNATSEFNGIYLRNSTLNHSVNINDYMSKRINIKIDKTKPTVLIYHTHTSETYELLDRGYYTNTRSTRSNNEKENMIRIGKEICETLEKMGYKTIHNTTVYDTEYDGAYERSCAEISEIIEKNPSIQIAIDVHRGTIYQKDGAKIKTVTTINGTKAAQILIISGCEDGNVTNFPDWEKNLTFALNLQKEIVNIYPKLARPIMFCSRKYNMHLLPNALQVEIGTDGNTLAEAVFSARLFALSLAEFLEEY